MDFARVSEPKKPDLGAIVTQLIIGCTLETTLRVLERFTYHTYSQVHRTVHEIDGKSYPIFEEEFFFGYDWPEEKPISEGPFETHLEAVAAALAHMRGCVSDESVYAAYAEETH